jgi:hypothetical protein
LTTCDDLYRAHVPNLQLRRWAKPIVRWLTHPALDPDATGRVTMDHLMRFVLSAVRRAYEQELTDVTDRLLEATAERLILRRDEVVAIDGIVTAAVPPLQEVG